MDRFCPACGHCQWWEFTNEDLGPVQTIESRVVRSPADALSGSASTLGFATWRTPVRTPGANANGTAASGDLDPRFGARLIGLGLMGASSALTLSALYGVWHLLAG